MADYEGLTKKELKRVKESMMNEWLVLTSLRSKIYREIQRVNKLLED